MARFYQALLNGGELAGVRLVVQATLREARRPSTSEGEEDQTLGLPIRWAEGFELGGPRPAASRCAWDS